MEFLAASDRDYGTTTKSNFVNRGFTTRNLFYSLLSLIFHFINFLSSTYLPQPEQFLLQDSDARRLSTRIQPYFFLSLNLTIDLCSVPRQELKIIVLCCSTSTILLKLVYRTLGPLFPPS